MNIDLTGRTALVTGASRGIGKEIAIALGAAGANVACIATNEALLQEVVGQIPNGLAIKTDVTIGDDIPQNSFIPPPKISFQFSLDKTKATSSAFFIE